MAIHRVLSLPHSCSACFPAIIICPGKIGKTYRITVERRSERKGERETLPAAHEPAAAVAASAFSCCSNSCGKASLRCQTHSILDLCGQRRCANLFFSLPGCATFATAPAPAPLLGSCPSIPFTSASAKPPLFVSQLFCLNSRRNDLSSLGISRDLSRSLQLRSRCVRYCCGSCDHPLVFHLQSSLEILQDFLLITIELRPVI